MYIKKQESIKKYDNMVKTVCALCPSGCGMKIYLKEDKIIDVWGDEDHPNNKGSLCPKGVSVAHYQYDEKRCLYPMIRSNLSEDFRRVTWDEALEYVKGRLETIREKNGPESLCIYPSPHTSFSNLMCSLRFGRLFSTPNIMNPFSKESSPLACVPHSIFGTSGIGCLMCPPQYWSESQTILVIESDITATDTMIAGFIIDAIERGYDKKLIVVDSKETILMSKAQFPIRINPGTAVALILGMGNVINDEELYDSSFIKKWSSGFRNWVKACEKYTPEEVERITGVSSGCIRQIARRFAKNRPSQVVCSSISNYYSTSADLLWACSSLVTSIGSIGVLGGGLNTLCNSPCFDPFVGLTTIPPSNTVSLTNAWDDNRLFRAIREETPYKIKAVIWDGDPMSQIPRMDESRKSVKEIDLIIHLTTHLNMTSNFAHVVFPISSRLETDGLLYQSNFRTLQWHRKVIESIGESQNYGEFWLKMAIKFNYGSYFPWTNENGSINIEKMSNYFLENNDSTAGITVELLREDKPLGGIFWPCHKSDDATFKLNTMIKENSTIRGGGNLFRRENNYPGSNNRFPTLSGKIELAPDDFKRRGWGNYPIYSEYSSNIQKDTNNNGTFPLILMTGSLIDSILENGYRIPVKNGIKLNNSHLEVNPRLASRLSLNNGGEVILESIYGRIETSLWISNSVTPDCVWLKAGTAGLMDMVDNNNGRGVRRMNMVMARIYKRGDDPIHSAKIITEYLNTLKEMNI